MRQQNEQIEKNRNFFHWRGTKQVVGQNSLAPLILIGAGWSMAQIDRLIEPDNLRP